MSRSLQSEDFDEYADMDHLFSEAMAEEEPDYDVTTQGSGVVVDFEFRTQDSVSGTLSVVIQVGEDEYGVYQTEVTAFETDEFVEVTGIRKLEDVLGTSIQYRGDSRQGVYQLTEPVEGVMNSVSAVERYTGRSDSMRCRMSDEFESVYFDADVEQFSTAEIIDYNVEEADSSVEQELAVKLWFELPTGRVKAFETIHDSDHPSPVLSEIFSRVGIEQENVGLSGESLFGLNGESVPIVHDNGEWKLHFGRVPSWFHQYLPFGIEVSRTVSFGVAYSHRKNTQDRL